MVFSIHITEKKKENANALHWYSLEISFQKIPRTFAKTISKVYLSFEQSFMQQLLHWIIIP